MANHFKHITERQFQAQVLDLATLYRWDLRYHPFDSRRSSQGFPDIVLVRPPRVIFAELKAEGGSLTAEQWEWLEALLRCEPPMEMYLWQPHDIEEIEAMLR